MKKLTAIALLFISFTAMAQQRVTVPKAVMQKVYAEVKTPYKYGLVAIGSDSSKMLDSPTVFWKDSTWNMTYIVFDGRGYETWLAKSNDLLHWKTEEKILSFSNSANWDATQKAGYPALVDMDWNGANGISAYHGKYWLSYLGGNAAGYEAGMLKVGIGYTPENTNIVHEWQRAGSPVLSPQDKDARTWEKATIYKSSIVWDKQKHTGHPFVMYYNAKSDTVERIGMAVSDDMLHWKRYGQQPVMDHHSGITGDAVIRKIGNVYVMFYFGAFWQGRNDAFNRFACSYDLIHWTDWTGEDLIHPSEPYDDVYAHKSWVLKHKGVVYHFYCAVNSKGHRGIAVATSKDIGKSSLRFAGE